MIGLVIWLLICLTWLLYETDFLRVRLLVGSLPTPIKPKRKPIKIYDYKAPWTRNFALSPGVKLGEEQRKWLKWADKHPELVNPPCRIDLRINGNRYAMKVNSPSVLKEVIKVNTIRHKPSLIARLSPPHRDAFVPSGREWWQAWQDALIPLEDALKTI